MTSSMSPVGASMQPEETTLKPRAGNEKGISGAPVPPSGGAPPAATSGAPPPQRAPVRQLQVNPNTPGLTLDQQMRAKFGNASPETVQNVMSRLPRPQYHPQQAQVLYPGETQVPPVGVVSSQRQREFQQNMGDPYQRFLSDYPTKSKDGHNAAMDRLIKAVEILQIEDARKDDEIIKHLPSNNLSVDSITDILYLAKMLDITSMDVSTILNTKGDWERISKTYGYSDRVVKVVKVSFGGV